MKTLSLRIRGAKVELQDAGEDIDGMAESTAKLQEKLLALTNGKVDIMLDANTFKSTTQIIREMADAWDDMTDIDRAAALELMGGKNQANVLAALIQNFDTAEEAIKTSADSAGSAMAENEKYMDSIQGHIDQFTNAVQTMWMNLINSDTVKGIVDIGTNLVQLLDTVYGKIIAIVTAIMAYQKIKNGVAFADMFKNTAKVAKQVVNVIKSVVAATESMSVATVAQGVASKITNKELAQQILIDAGLASAEGAVTKAHIEATAAKLTEAYSNGTLSASQYLAAMSTMGLKTALQGLWTVLKSNPVALVATVVAAAALAFDHFHTTAQEAAEAAKEAFEQIQEVVDATESTIQSLESELSTLQEKIDELNGKSLSFADEKELEKLQEQRQELEHSLKVQQQLLDLQRDASNKQAVVSMQAYTKAASEGAEETQKTATTIGTIAGVLVGIVATVAGLAAIPASGGTSSLLASMGVSSIATSVGIGATAGGMAGNKAGEAIGSSISENDGTYDSWYKTYTDALEAARKDEQEALKKYQNDSSDIKKLDKWKESQQRVSDIETEMYEHLSQMQKYYSGLEYGVSDEIDQELNAWDNFLDKFSIDQGASDAEVTALDRIFGEHASEDIKELKTQILDAIDAGEDFDFTSAINESQELKSTLDYVGLSAEDVKKYFLQVDSAMRQAAATTSVATTDLASLSSAYDSYVSASKIVNDTMFDGQAISDDYYDSLSTYLNNVTVGEESFSDAVDNTNGNIIKNTQLLRKLIAQKKQEQKATVSAAKAQGQAQYTKVVKQLQQAVKAMYADYKAYGYVTKATYDNISALRSQIQALKNAVKEYSILELKLSDVTNAYDEFEDAKNRDSEMAYGDSMVEMLETISDGLLSGKVGTEAFKAACEALVPPSVIANCKTFEERLDAIDDYFENSKFADYFTIDDDGNFSIGLKNIEAFIADAKEASAFIENADGTFTLDSSIKSVDDLANAMGLTKAATIAMLTELSKYDASWGDIVSDLTMTELDKKLRDTTDSLDKALAKQEEFFKAGKDPLGENAEEYNAIQQEIDGATDSLNNAQQAIVDNTKAWIDANNTVDTAKENVSTLTRELQELKDAGASDEEIQIKTDELEKAKEQLAEALKIKYGLEQPTVMDFQVVLTDVQSKIDQWKEENATLVTEVVPKLEQDKDGVWKIPATLELDEDQQQKIQEYVDLKNDEQQLEVLTNQEVDPITDGITQVKEVLDNILDAIQSPDKNKKQDTKTTDTTKTSSGTTSTSIEKSASTTSTSNVTGFEAQSPDQVIAGWNALVDEVVVEVQQFANNIWSGISTFFTETLPTVWDNLWSGIGDKLSGAEEWAQGLWEDINTFFTDTLPQKWDEFWNGVGECLDGVKDWAANVEEGVNTFFTETIPEKWNEFWGSVGEFLGDIPYAVGYISAKVEEFFTETVPEKWGEFWDNVSEDFDKVKQWASDLKDAVVTFFTETIPEKWDEFWDGVGEELNNLKEDAIALKDKVVEFFTTTIPTKWSEFWTSVGQYIDGTIAPALSAAWDSVYGFFTETVPEKWHSFWESVGTYVDEVIGPALVTAGEKILEFFTATLPTKWNEFWEGVGTFLTETVPTTLENIKTGISTFFTETVPSAINGLWESASSWISTQASNFWNNLKSKFTQGREDAKSGSGYNPDGASSALGNALAKGNAHSGKKPGLKANEHNAIVGELGRELVVDANKGVYYTVGEHGTEMLDLPKGAIIYNHKQTEELLKNGYTSRGTYTGGLSFAKGNAHWNYGTYTKKTGTGANAAWGDGSDKDWSQMGWDLSDAASDLSDAASDVSDAADDAEQTIDFIEYKLEEIEKAITHMTNRIENFLDDTSQIGDKNSLYDDLVGAEKQKASTYFAAAELYNQKATELLSKVPAEYQEMAKNGAIAIKDFIGESEGEIADAIEEYRTWSTKAEDAENSYLESIAEISAKRLEQLNDIADDFENIVGLVAQHSSLIQAEMDLLDEAGERLSENFYQELMKDSQKQIEDLNNKRASLQSILDQAVASGDVRVGTDDWYEMVNAIYDVDDSILSCKKDIEGFQNSINDLYWDNLDKLIDKIDNVDSELSHLYNLVSDEEKVVDEFGNWTKDGVTALGLLAQQLETANFKVEQYGEAIARLEKDYAAGLYSTDEYNEKLAELKENQWDAIEAQESAKKSIIDLNKTRVQAVKDGMQKEIDAYSELIDKKKDELSLQKEANDFAKQVAEKQKSIADIQKRLVAIAGDNSASAIAQKKKLKSELQQAQDELNDLYYDHSIEKQQEALDKSLENYQDNKQDEMDALDESLKNENQVIQDSYAVIAANTDSLAQNLSEIADKYGITLSDSVTKPWLEGVDAIGTYQEQLDTSASAFTEQLRALKQELVDLQVEADKTADSIIKATNSKKNSTESAKYTPPTPSTPQQSPATEPATPAAPTKGSSVTVKSSATHFSRDGGSGTRMQSWVPGSTFTVYQATDSEVLIGRNGGYTGWVRLSDLEGYASGAKSISKDQFAFLDELGEELQLVPDGAGRLSYIKKGTGIIPADLTERLMEWGKLDPSSVLEQSKPTVSAPHIINNNIELNMQIGEVVHVERADNSSIPNIAKAVQDQMDNYMKNINKKLYNRVR